MSKQPFFEAIAKRYVSRRLRKTFFDVRISHAERLLQAMTQGPIVIAANHVCWWDPLIMIHLGAKLSMDGYCLMDRANLERMRFFSAVGAVPVTLHNSRAAARDLVLASKLLDRSGRVLAIFPHGAQRPAHLPLQFKQGVYSICRHRDVPALPLSIRYDFHEGPRALVHLTVGEPQRIRPAEKPGGFVERIEAQVREGFSYTDALLQGDGAAESLLYDRTRSLVLERQPFGARFLRWSGGEGAQRHDS